MTTTSPTLAAADAAVRRMVEEITPGTVVTWLNHWSLQHADFEALGGMDLIGIDGTLLQLALRHHGHAVGRTSADLVLPHVIAALPHGSAVVLVGAAPGVAERAAARLTRPGLTLHTFDGFADLVALRRRPEALAALEPDLVVVGLGAALQDQVALEFHAALPGVSVCTAGGWLDQLAASAQYFPTWVHRARLGWAWRIAHEPRRLLRRYTLDAAEFRHVAPELIARLRGVGGGFGPVGFDRRAVAGTDAQPGL